MTMERYAKYKDSGVDWIGEIPEGWDVTPLKHIASVIYGFPFDAKQFNNQGRGKPLIRIRDITSGTTETSFDGEYPTYSVVHRGDVLVGMDGDFNVRVWLGSEALLNQRCCKVLGKELIHDSFLAYCLPFALKQINELKYATTVKHLSDGDISNIALPLPSIPTQQTITDYLDKKTAAIDAAVANVERSIELLNEYRQSVISETVTKGLNPNVPMKDSGINWIGQIPQQWTVTKIVNLATRKSGHTPDKKKEEYWRNGNIVWISLADSPTLRKQHYVSESNAMTNREGINHSSAELLPPGTVLLSRDASIGLTAIAATELAVSQHFMAYICGPQLYNEYLYYAFESMQQELKRLSMGSTIPTIGLPLIHSLRIPVPPIEEQHEIVDYLQHKLEELDSLISEKESLIVRLQEYRSSLISECVTGKVKVPGVKE